VHHLPLVQLCLQVPPAALCIGSADSPPACASAAPSSARCKCCRWRLRRLQARWSLPKERGMLNMLSKLIPLRPRPLLISCLQVQSSMQESSPRGLLSAMATPQPLPPYGPTELVPLCSGRGMRCLRLPRLTPCSLLPLLSGVSICAFVLLYW
jgi:hypothetical protein